MALSATYDRTIFTTPTNGDNWGAPYSEFFQLPLKSANEITIAVSASQYAEVLLHHENPVETDAKPIVVTIGGDSNKSCSIHVKGDATPQAVVLKEGLLSATSMRAFTIRWNRGMVSLFDEGYSEPLVWWQSPVPIFIDKFGIRTVGSAGVWSLSRGGKLVNTADSKEYQFFPVLSGRIEFELKSGKESYVLLTTKPVRVRGSPELGLNVGGWNNSRTAIYNESSKLNYFDLENTNSLEEYRGWWFEWDATSCRFGKRGVKQASTSWMDRENIGHQFEFFGVASGYDSYGFWHILDPYPHAEYLQFVEKHKPIPALPLGKPEDGASHKHLGGPGDVSLNLNLGGSSAPTADRHHGNRQFIIIRD